MAMRCDTLTWLSRGLSATGLALSIYLLYTYLHHDAPVCFAGGGGGCVKVEHSSYAQPLGIPMPLFGVIGYLMLMASTFVPGERGRTLGMVFAFVAITASVILTYLEVAVIHAICYWCVSSAICATLHLIVNSARFVRGDPSCLMKPGTGTPVATS